MRKILTAFFLCLFFYEAGYSAEKLDVTVTHPWLALIASFIGGPEVNITPLQIWNSDGDLIKAERGRVLRELGSNAKIIALDENDARSAGLKDGTSFRPLYSPFPVDINKISDPSVIPFVAQRVLTALSEWDPQNYPYYQRRLAEFQARLSSSVLAGQVLKGISVCDISASSGILLQAAGCKVGSPDPKQLEQWQKGRFTGLREYLDTQKAQGVVIIIDDGTPKPLKKYLAGRSEVFHWKRPALDSDYPTFLHEQYISLWQKIIARPLPGRNKKR